MKTNHKYSIYQVLIFVLLFTIIISNECDRSTPIRIHGSCVLEFCTQQQFNNKDCIIDNQIIKTQYLNHIIILDEILSIQSSVGPKVDITKYSNGDIVSLSFSFYSEKGKFFGFKKNGGYLYGNDENIFSEDSFKYISGYNNIYDTQLFILREENNNNNQYLISSNNFVNNYFEIYDLDSNSKYNYNYNDIFKMIDVGFTDEGFTENKGIGSVFEILDTGNYYTIISSLFQKMAIIIFYYIN